MVDFNGKLVGKYTTRPMDPMGLFGFLSSPRSLREEETPFENFLRKKTFTANHYYVM